MSSARAPSFDSPDRRLSFTGMSEPDETLHPELAEALTEINGQAFIRHPLHCKPFKSQGETMLFLGPREELEWHNKALAQKKALVEEAYESSDWKQYVDWHEKPYRGRAIQYLSDMDELSHHEYWGLLTYVWPMVDTPSTALDTWAELWTSSRPKPEGFFTLPVSDDPLKVFRGVQLSLMEDGLSWTLSRKRAQWFADRHGDDGHVFERKVLRKDVLYYTNAREEQEIVILPKSLLDESPAFPFIGF